MFLINSTEQTQDSPIITLPRQTSQIPSCDTGVISKPEYGGIKRVIRLLSIIHNGIILDLVRGFGGSAGEDVRADFLSFRVEKSFLFISERASEKG